MPLECPHGTSSCPHLKASESGVLHAAGWGACLVLLLLEQLETKALFTLAAGHSQCAPRLSAHIGQLLRDTERRPCHLQVNSLPGLLQPRTSAVQNQGPLTRIQRWPGVGQHARVLPSLPLATPALDHHVHAGRWCWGQPGKVVGNHSERV